MRLLRSSLFFLVCLQLMFLPSQSYGDINGRVGYDCRSAAKFLQYFPNPIKSIKSVWSDGEKRFYVFQESLIYTGIPAGILGTILGRSISGSEIFVDETLWNFAESYVSYNAANVVRQGVNLEDPNILSQAEKWLINYAYTVAIYTLMTVVARGGLDPILEYLSNPASGEEVLTRASYALGLTGFAFLWPLISQGVSTYISTPYLFDGFPKGGQDGFISLMFDVSQQERISRLEKLRSSVDEKLKSGTAQERRVAEKEYLWLKWATTGLEIGDKLPFFTAYKIKKPWPVLKKSKFWALKIFLVAAFAATMISAYLFVRFNLIGTREKDESGVKKIKPSFVTEWIKENLQKYKEQTR